MNVFIMLTCRNDQDDEVSDNSVYPICLARGSSGVLVFVESSLKLVSLESSWDFVGA